MPMAGRSHVNFDHVEFASPTVDGAADSGSGSWPGRGLAPPTQVVGRPASNPPRTTYESRTRIIWFVSHNLFAEQNVLRPC